MRDYGKALLDCMGARAIWEPGASVKPGDYGQIEQGCFLRLGSITDFGVPVELEETKDGGRYELSQGLQTDQHVSAAAQVQWTGSAVSSLRWGGGAGLVIAAPSSVLLTVKDLGNVVEAIMMRSRDRWRFSWRLVRQVRVLHGGTIALAGNSMASGQIDLVSSVPVHEGSASAGTNTKMGFSMLRLGVNGAVYASVVRLKPWLMHGAAPLDNELWYEDSFDDE